MKEKDPISIQLLQEYWSNRTDEGYLYYQLIDYHSSLYYMRYALNLAKLQFSQLSWCKKSVTQLVASSIFISHVSEKVGNKEDANLVLATTFQFLGKHIGNTKFKNFIEDNMRILLDGNKHNSFISETTSYSLSVPEQNGGPESCLANCTN